MTQPYPSSLLLSSCLTPLPHLSSSLPDGICTPLLGLIQQLHQPHHITTACLELLTILTKHQAKANMTHAWQLTGSRREGEETQPWFRVELDACKTVGVHHKLHLLVIGCVQGAANVCENNPGGHRVVQKALQPCKSAAHCITSTLYERIVTRMRNCWRALQCTHNIQSLMTALCLCANASMLSYLVPVCCPLLVAILLYVLPQTLTRSDLADPRLSHR